MESYPSEFVAATLPLMFVAGLGAPTPAPPPPVTTPSAADGATSPPAASVAPTDLFAVLLGSLRKAMTTRKSWHVWDNSRGVNNDFHIIAVDKNVRFPPLKARPPSASQQPPAALHSPISPLSQSSPLYPDGIMAPIWIRKHREMVPAVFVLVLRLGEYNFLTTGPLDTANKEEEERKQDAELVREILERKRSTLERGIKLAVVLLCSRRLLDDPALDSRLSLIRRQSGLDSRASLFIISPVPQSEVNNFVLSLRGELYPAALDYYREHGRRVRRKRARQVPKGGLSDKGWTVRYDYKMALFSEMRGEIEVALKHYEDCYDTLVEMFSHTSLLAPRTKRWAEAKVLADCLTVKVAKMYLYLNEASRAVSQLYRHVARFRELSNTWGIGEQTFEFWSWLSKQYRLFGDLVAIGMRAGFRLPSLRPPPSTRAAAPGAPTPSLIPVNVLQHPGYYFYLAGTCAVERRERFRALVQSDAAKAVQNGGQPAPVSPAVAHETKVDHAEIIIEIFTKAYEFFKAHKTKNMTFFVASQIALAHYEGGNYEMALKFHDRILKNYRRDQWRTILDSILQLSADSAMKTGENEAAIRSLVELLAPDSRITAERRAAYAAQLQGILTNTTPSSPDKAVVSFNMNEIAPLFDCELAFLNPTSDIGHAVPFQLVLTSPPTARSSFLIFSKLEIQFNDDRPPIVVDGADQSSSSMTEHVQIGDVGSEAVRPASLCWVDGSFKVFSGSISPSRQLDLTISTVTLTAVVGEWTLRLLLPVRDSMEPKWRVGDSALPLQHATPSVCRVRPRDLRVGVTIEHDAPAYIDEAFDVHIAVTNEDEVEVEVFLDILLQPGEDDSPNYVTIDDQTTTSFIKAVSLGVLSPSASLRKTFQLSCVGSPGDRQLDLSIRCQPVSTQTAPEPLGPSTEILRTLNISAVRPLHCAFDTHFHERITPVKPLLDLTEPDGWDGASEATIIVKLHAAGPWDIEVTAMRVHCEKTSGVRLLHFSLTGLEDNLSLQWRPRDLFTAVIGVQVSSSLPPPSPDAAYFEIAWRRHGSNAPSSILRTALPSLTPLPLLPQVILALPPSLVLHEPTSLSYTLSNPTPRLLRLSLQVDSAPDPGTFVFAGPRKMPSLILAPSERRTVDVKVVPLVVGRCRLPRLRVFLHDVVAEEELDATPEEKVTEIIVVAEEAVRKEPGLEDELREARSEEGVVDFAVLVLPR